jgi:argininosuccinate lyase
VSTLRGRFDGPVEDEMLEFSSSLDVDLQMLDEEVDASIAHATMLGETGIISEHESMRIREGLEQVRREIAEGEWTPQPRHEDVHMAVEARLTEIVGDAGKKLHTARSRNDQVATAVRLWLRFRLDGIDAALRGLIRTLLDRVEGDGRALLPGYTHLQRGQPILLGHQLLAHTWALKRDRERMADARRRLDRSPLGACAMAGTPHPIDRERTAELLGFAGVADNAMDAVAARDHEQEVAAACAICMTNLSRMAEELVLWSATEWDLVRLADTWTTGSSIMPQKRNPDAAELIRGRTAGVYGDLQALLSLVKALPLAYNRDLQEGRAPLFRTVQSTLASLRVMNGMWKSLEVRSERFEQELRGDFSLATELADHLVTRGVPFREAHEIVGSIVRWCEERGGDLTALDADAAGGFHPELATGLAALLDPRAAAERRDSFGGTAWGEVERQVEVLRAATEDGGRPA